MDILLRTTSPSLTAECQLTFNDVFRPQCDRNLAIQSLRCIRHEDSGAVLKRTLDIGLIHDLLEVRRETSLQALSDSQRRGQRGFCRDPAGPRSPHRMAAMTIPRGPLASRRT